MNQTSDAGRDGAAKREPAALRPMLRLNDRLDTGGRLTVLAVALTLPGLFAVAALVQAISLRADLTAAELSGIEVVTPALTAMSQLVAGDPASLDPLAQAVHNHPELALGEEMAAVRSAAGSANTRAHLKVVQALASLISAAGDSSKLTLDSDLDASYLADIQIVQIPRMLTAAATAPEPGEPPRQDLVERRAMAAGRVSVIADALAADLGTALENTAHLQALGDLRSLQALADAGTAFSEKIGSASPQIRVLDVAALAESAKAAVAPAGQALTQLLRDRRAGLALRRDTTLLVTLLGFVLAIWFMIAMLWRTRRDARLTLEAVEAIADGDLEPRTLPPGRDELARTGRSADRLRSALAEQAAEFERAQTARDILAKASFQRQRAAEQRVRVRAQEIIDEAAQAVVEELGQLHTHVEQVRGAAAVVDARADVARTVTSAVVEHSAAADRGAIELGESLQRVGGLTTLISGVAGQTKLLALNATIEAARAGAAGRGFSVVAGEVKALAGTTAESTGEISTMLKALEDNAGDVGRAITTVGENIAGLDEATCDLRETASTLNSLVSRLDARLSATLSRVSGMATLTQRLERRAAQRQTVSGMVTMEVPPGVIARAELRDLSLSGLRCLPENAIELPEPGREMPIEITIGGRTLQTTAEVARHIPGAAASELAFHFTERAPHVAEMVGQFLSEADEEPADPADASRVL